MINNVVIVSDIQQTDSVYLPSSSLHGTLQARVLEWVAFSFSRGSSRPRDRIQVSRIPGRRFNLWATREAQVIHTHISIPFQIISPFRLFHNIDQSSLSCIIGLCWLSILSTEMYMSIPSSLAISPYNSSPW